MPWVTGMRWRQPSLKSPQAQSPTVLVVVRSHPSFHPYQQGIKECGPLLLGYPFKFSWAEVRVRRYSEGNRRRARGVGARAHTHLERHLGLVCPLGFEVPESVRQEAKRGPWGLWFLSRLLLANCNHCTGLTVPRNHSHLTGTALAVLSKWYSSQCLLS